MKHKHTQLIKMDDEEYLFYNGKNAGTVYFCKKLVNLLLIKLQSKKFILIVRWPKLSMLLTSTLNKYLILFLHFQESFEMLPFFYF